MNTGESIATEARPVVAHQTIFHDGARRSYVTLPIVDAPRRIPRP